MPGRAEPVHHGATARTRSVPMCPG
jgi:hypothetical protein